MYSINAKNLKFAYLKLKRYVYYYSSSNYLKNKLIKFEEKLKHNENIFEEYSKELNRIGKNKYDILVSNDFNHIFYPKKDSFEMKNGNINLNSINVFIDMKIMYYLNDILFCFELFNIYKSIDKGHFFGNLFDKHLDLVDNPLENNLLFDSYWKNYKQWKETIFDKVDFDKNKTATLVKLDFQRCYYQTRFNLKKLLIKNHIDIDNPIVNISLHVYRLYSSKMYKLSNEKKEEQIVQLPLGLPSAAILQNILFADFDKKMIESGSIISYSRYVDDVLFLVNKNFDALCELKNYVASMELDEDNRDGFTKINVSNDIISSLKINQKKIEIKSGISNKNFKRKMNTLPTPSLIDLLDEEASEDPNKNDEPDELSDLKYIKNKINKLFESNAAPEEVDEFLNSVKDIDILNAYSCWNKLCFLLNEDKTLLKNFKGRVLTLIGKIKYTNDDNFFSPEKINNSLIQDTLKEELNTALQLIEKNNYYLFNITQKELFEYIRSSMEEQQLYFPLYVKMEYIESFLCLNDCLNKNILLESRKIYEKINNLKLNQNHPAYNIEIKEIVDADFDKESNKLLIDKEYSTIFSFKLKTNIQSVFENMKVGVVSLKMPLNGIKNDDYPKTYSFKDLIKNINIAKKCGAKYLLMPEFCIPYKDLTRILDYCIKKDISLIAGLRHKKEAESNFAINYIVIYDSIMKMALLKRKNYYPYEEKLFLAENKLLPKTPTNPYYIRIDNGLCQYSTMTCFEATNIRDRSFLKDKINILFMPVYNKDTYYFSDIIGSLARDISAFVVQANNSEYGDSRISGPMDSIHKDIVKLKGGDNCFTVVGTLDFVKMKDKHTFMSEICTSINGLNISDPNLENECDKIRRKIDENKKENEFKPLSAGSDMETRKKYSIE